MLIFIGLAVVFSIISQTGQDLFIIIGVVWYLKDFFQSSNKKNFFSRCGIEWAFIGLAITTVAGLMIKFPGQWEYLNPAAKLKWILLFYVFFWAFRQYSFQAEDSNRLILPLSLIASVYGIMSYYHGTDYLHPEIPSTRILGLVSSPTYHAHGAAILLAFAAPILIQRQGKRNMKNLLSWISFILLGVSIYLTYTRGTHLALIFAFTIGTAIVNKKWFISWCLGLFIGLGLLYSTDPVLQSRVEETVVKERQDQGRIGLFKSHLQIFLDNPVLGMGYDAYKNPELSHPYAIKNNIPDRLMNSHSHNQFLQMLSSMGIVGFFFFTSIVAFFLLKTIKLVRKYQRQLTENAALLSMACLWAQLEIIAGFLTDQSFEYAKIRLVIIVVWSLVAALDWQNEKNLQ